VPKQGFDRVWGSEELGQAELDGLIGQLDTAAREGSGLDRKLAQQLLDGIGRKAPASMSLVSWRLFFNSSLNALAVSEKVSSNEIARVLLEVMEHDTDKVMRLYALQHLGGHQPKVTGPLRGEIGRRVAVLAYDENDAISGTALVVLEQWKGKLDADGSSVPEEDRAAAVVRIMSDGNRATDVRVSAVHAAVDGGYRQALPAARAIAANRAGDVMLRKAAINLIGQLGNGDDAALLRGCATENSRIAKAAAPALERLSKRLEGRPEPQLTLYH
jgi:hypothetical protein